MLLVQIAEAPLYFYTIMQNGLGRYWNSCNNFRNADFIGTLMERVLRFTKEYRVHFKLSKMEI